MRIYPRMAAVAAAFIVVLGGAVAAAPTATAVGADRCDKNVTDHWRTVTDLAGAAVRSGPGKAYKKRETLDFADHFYVVCQDTNRYGNVWYYGHDEHSNAFRTWGWVYSARTDKGRY